MQSKACVIEEWNMKRITVLAPVRELKMQRIRYIPGRQCNTIVVYLAMHHFENKSSHF